MIDLSSPASYLHLGIILISVPNLVVIVVMLLVFALAVLLRMPEPSPESGDQE